MRRNRNAYTVISAAILGVVVAGAPVSASDYELGLFAKGGKSVDGGTKGGGSDKQSRGGGKKSGGTSDGGTTDGGTTDGGTTDGGTTDPGTTTPIDHGGTWYSWMAGDVQGAWDSGYYGQNTTITVVDDFNSGSLLNGDLGTGAQSLTHGQWTAMQSGMIAPGAQVNTHDFYSGQAVGLSAGFNAINLSYGMMAAHGYDVNQIGWSPQEDSIISYARAGSAFVSKAAGNDGVAIGAANASGNEDYLGTALIGAQSAVFVGALSSNGSTSAPASLAWYSNTPGTNAVTQEQFLVVGVDGGQTGLYGTSFAAPIVAGYGAIVSSKFTDATPTMVADQLLGTARTDTIAGYNVTLHGQGEACLRCALAPTGIN